MKFLIIEDDEEIANIEVELLSQGNEVIVAHDMHDATTEKIAADYYQAPFECVILDLALPDFNPYQVMKRAHELFSGIPVVVISGLLDDPGIVETAQSYGFFCIDKMFLSEAQEFLRLFTSAREASKRMRTLTNHLTSGAWEIALTDTAKCVPVAEKKPGDVTYKDRTESRSYLMFSATACITFLSMVWYWMLNDRPIPYQLWIIVGCGIAIGGPLGVMPWVVAYFKGELPSVTKKE